MVSEQENSCLQPDFLIFLIAIDTFVDAKPQTDMLVCRCVHFTKYCHNCLLMRGSSEFPVSFIAWTSTDFTPRLDCQLVDLSNLQATHRHSVLFKRHFVIQPLCLLSEDRSSFSKNLVKRKSKKQYYGFVTGAPVVNGWGSMSGVVILTPRNNQDSLR